MRPLLLMAIFLAVAIPSTASGREGGPDSPQALILGAFQAGRLDGWEPEIFEGKTRYRLVESGRGTVLEGVSKASASGLVRRGKVDLVKTPVLNWSWKTERLLEGNDERTRQGDDFPVRIYVVVSGGMLFWKTRALNYVWSRHQPVGSHWPNPFSGIVHMLAVESGKGREGRWVAYKRNVRQDLKTYLGMDVAAIQAVALMVDTDNTGQQARSFFGDIYFTAD